MSERKYFGTDGIRGKVGESPITPDFVLKLGWAAGKVLAGQGSKKSHYRKRYPYIGIYVGIGIRSGLGRCRIIGGVHRADANPSDCLFNAYIPRRSRCSDIRVS